MYIVMESDQKYPTSAKQVIAECNSIRSIVAKGENPWVYDKKHHCTDFLFACCVRITERRFPDYVCSSNAAESAHYK